MTMGMLYWVLFVIWAVVEWGWATYSRFVIGAMLFLLGWSEFGFIIRGGGP